MIEVLSIEEKDGMAHLEVEMSLGEYRILVLAGLQLVIEDLGYGEKVKAIPIEQAEKFKGMIDKKGVKQHELSDEEEQFLLNLAFNEALRSHIDRLENEQE